MDNDMVLLGNIDELAEHAEAPGMVRVRVRVMWRRGPWLTLTLSLTLTEAPGMVWHTATVLARKERAAVTGGNPNLKPGLNPEPRPNPKPRPTPNPDSKPDPKTRSAPPSRAACLC